MHYLIYEIRNNKNDKVYIGKHKTKDINDDYMGSGKIIKRSIEKYGIENFTKTILFELETEQEMNNKEAEIVNEEFIKCGSNYNLMVGGEGGWDYVNKSNLNNINGDNCKNAREAIYKRRLIDKDFDDRLKKVSSENFKKAHNDGKIKYDTFTGKKHSNESKIKMSLSAKGKHVGEKNSQFGSVWIYSLEEKVSKKIKKEELITYEKLGWLKGRKMKF